MKKLLLTAAMALFSFGSAFSVEFVSTEPQTRNVLIEEYTGVNCTWCPLGHKVAKGYADNNEGKVFVVNIHQGGFANPGANQLNFKTPQGDSLGSYFGISSYPAAMVSRSHQSSITPYNSQGNENLSQYAAPIMAQTSPVNIAVRSSFNATNRELTTEVEYYYTSASSAATNYLTVYLLQDNMYCYQVGASRNPDNLLDNGLYRHMHALRMVLNSGNCFGEVISNTSQGQTKKITYKHILPASIQSIPVEFSNLSVVAFITENQRNVITATGADVDYPRNLVVDLSLENKTEAPATYCTGTINPKVDVYNETDSTITSFDVYAIIGSNQYKKSFSGTLASNQSTTLDWGSIDLPESGAYTLSFSGFYNVNANKLYDFSQANNMASFSNQRIKPKAFTSLVAKFDASAANANLIYEYAENSYYEFPWQSATFASAAGITISKAGALKTKGAIVWLLMNNINGVTPNEKTSLIFGEADFTSATAPHLEFYYAFSDGGVDPEPTAVSVYASEDCGANWVLEKTFNAENTTETLDKTDFYVPTFDEYKRMYVDLAKYIGKTPLIKIEVLTGDDGNTLWLDEININSTPSEVVAPSMASFKIYPNPADLEIKLNDQSAVGLNYSIVNLLGETVVNGVNNTNSIDISNLNTGCYYLVINNTTHKFVKK